MGRLKDETGDRLTPTHAGANGKRYRYYVSNRLSLGATGEGTATPGGWRLPAKALEDQVAGAVLAHLSARLPVDLLTSPSADVIARLDTHLAYLAARVGAKGPGPILDCVAAVKISPGQVEVQLDQDRTADCLEIAPTELAEAALAFKTPFLFRKRGFEMKLVIGAASLASLDATLIRSIAKAHLYYEAIKEGRSFDEIAASENLSRRRILQVIDLAFMTPDLVRTILRGEQPIGLTAKWLGINPLPSDWDKQRRTVATR